MSLRLIGVSKRYGDQQVLDGVSLHVRKGDCYGFLGHNGAGKTTAMRVALGLLAADAGTVLVEGFDAALHPLEARARMGALIEVPGFHTSLTGRRNLVLLARLQGLSAREAPAEADRALELVGLSHAAAKAAGAYSHGMRQRLGIAQALLGRPRIVLLDEPTNGLDPEGIEQIRRLLRHLTREEGTTVLLSSHQLHEIEGVCNRVGILRQGRLLVEEETERLRGAGSERHVVRTGDDAAAARVLAGLGLAPRDAAAAGGGLEVDLVGRAPGDVARALVAAGIDLRSFGPRATTLEEIYLRYSADGGPPAGARTGPPAPGGSPRDPSSESGSVPGPPAERLAAPGPVQRVASYDLRRWGSSPAVPLALAAPAAVAALAVVAERFASDAAESSVAAGRIASTTTMTAFAATALGMRWGLPVLAFVASAVAALSLADEFGRGTLRNVVLRPVGRAGLVGGKLASALVAASAGYLLLAAAAMGSAAALFEFGDVVEMLVTGNPFPMEGYGAAELWPVLRSSIAAQAPSVLSFAALGTLAGAFARSGSSALVCVLSAIVVLAAAPAAALGRGAGEWLPSQAVPWLSPKGTPVGHLLDMATATSNATTTDWRATCVPAAWFAATAICAWLKVRRRAIP